MNAASYSYCDSYYIFYLTREKFFITNAMGRKSGGQEGPAPLQYLCGGHQCYWPLLENDKSASSLAADLGHDRKLLKLLPPNVRL